MPAEPKTRPTDASVDDFLAAVEHPQRRADGFATRDLLAELTGEPAVMWGPSIVGFGTYQGSTGAWPVAGFSPRKADLVIYLKGGWTELRPDLAARLGKYRTGVSCLYVKRLSDLDPQVLRELCAWSITSTRENPPAC